MDKKIMGMTALALLAQSASLPAKEHRKADGKEKLPNIVLMLIDDMGYMDITCDGSTFHQTPNIDALAEAGIRFTSGYSACTVSSPTRAALMTGKYPARLHLTDWIPGQVHKEAPMQAPDWCQYLPEKEVTVAEVLRDAGYDTWHVGKWHLDGVTDITPLKQGFDVSIGANLSGKGHEMTKEQKKASGHYFPPYFLDNLKDGDKDEYLTERLADEAVTLIRDHEGEKPFFLYFAHYAVHTPLMAPPEMEDRYEALADPEAFQHNPTYAAMVESVDNSVEEIVRTLKEKGEWENTLFIFVSDNGAFFKSSLCTPFRDGKGSAYEGGVRVPMIMTWPGHIAPSTLCDVPTITMDISATLMDIVGSRQIRKTDGVSLLPLFEGKTIADRPLFWHYPHNHRGGSLTYSAVRDGKWRLVEHLWNNKVELYDLSQDISEKNDLSSAYPEKTREMHQLLKEWRKEVNAQMPVPNPDYK